MAANFGILQGITPPSVVAQLPASAPDNSANSLAGGLVSGLQAGQAIKASQQQMDQEAALFPGKKTIQDQTIQENSNKLDAQNQSKMDAQQIRDAAKKGFDSIVDTMMQQGNAEGAMGLLKSKAEIANIYADIGIKNATTKKTELSLTNDAVQQVASVYNTAHLGGFDPQTGKFNPARAQQVYNYARKTLPKYLQENMDLLPVEYKEENNLINLVLASDIAAKMPKSGTPSDTRKRVDEVNAQRKAAGQPPLSQQEQSDLLSQGLKTSISPNRGQVNPYDSALASQDAVIAKEASTTRQSMETLHADAQNALKQLPNVPEFALGPIAKTLKIDKLSPDAQRLTGSLNAMALQLKDYYKLGSGQGFTDADRDFLTEIAGNTGYYKYPLKDIITRMDKIAASARYNSWKKESGIRKQGTKYEDWLKENPEPTKQWEVAEPEKQPSQTTSKILTFNPSTGKLE